MKDKGFSSPTTTFNPKDEDHFKLVITGSQPKGDHTLVQSFYSDYWWGDLIFEETGGSTTNDSITVTAHIYHHAGKDRPHTGDALTGETALLKLTLDAGAASKNKSSGDLFSATANGSPDKKAVNIPRFLTRINT